MSILGIREDFHLAWEVGPGGVAALDLGQGGGTVMSACKNPFSEFQT